MDKYAVLGNPIGHSKSPFIHTIFAQETNQDMEYGSILSPLDGFKETVDNFRKNGGKGLNITVPFKEEAYKYADNLSDRAKKAGAVNTLKFLDDGSSFGDNTDGFGFIWDLKRLNWEVKDSSILLIGAGGALKGIIGPIMEEKPKNVVLVNRTIEKARAIKELYPSIKVLSFEDLNGSNETFNIVVNCTSLSLSNKLPNISEKFITKNSHVYDLMYSNKNTIFLDWAKSLGCNNISDGLGMLVGQAALSFNLWRGVMPESKNVFLKLRELIKNA